MYTHELRPWERDTDVCAAILEQQLFNVPCDVEQFLRDDYGPNWMQPHHDDNYVWLVSFAGCDIKLTMFRYKSHFNVRNLGKWPNGLWEKVYRTSFFHLLAGPL